MWLEVSVFVEPEIDEEVEAVGPVGDVGFSWIRMPATVEVVVSAVFAMGMSVGLDDEPLGSVVEVTAALAVHVLRREVVPPSIVVVVSAVGAVGVVAGGVVPESIVVVVTAASVVAVMVAGVGKPDSVLEEVSAAVSVHVADAEGYPAVGMSVVPAVVVMAVVLGPIVPASVVEEVSAGAAVLVRALDYFMVELVAVWRVFTFLFVRVEANVAASFCLVGFGCGFVGVFSETLKGSHSVALAALTGFFLGDASAFRVDGAGDFAVGIEALILGDVGITDFVA